MPKKTSSKTETEQVTATHVVIESVAVEKKARKPKTDVVPITTDVAPITTDVAPITTDVVGDVPTATDIPLAEAPLVQQSDEFLAKLQQLGVLISSLKAEYRILEKKWTREVKTAQKQSSKRKRKASNRAPSGFVKPTKISDELASFLGKEKGTEMARTDVTREINTYIRANKLQDKDNGRKIIPDKKLATLLKLNKTDELTYFNLQKYMSPHFAKAVKVEVVVA
jgi:upstream activation factor subunit UAF30